MLDHAWFVLIRFVHCEFTLRTGWGDALFYMVRDIRQATSSPSRRMKARSRRMKARVTGRVALLKFTEFAETALRDTNPLCNWQATFIVIQQVTFQSRRDSELPRALAGNSCQDEVK